MANTRPPDAYISLRTQPGSSAGQRIDRMPNGTRLQILDRRPDGWWRVREVVSGQEGWALSAQGSRTWIVCCAAQVTLTVPSFKVSLTYSPAARRKLLATGEQSHVSASYYANIDNESLDEDLILGTDELDVGNDTEILMGGRTETFPDPRRGKTADPMLLINVRSAWKASKFNILSCAIFHGPMSAAAKNGINILCKLIDEP